VESVYAGSNATCPTEEAHAAQRKVYGRRVGVPEGRGGVGDMAPDARISSGWVARGLRHEAARWRRSLDSDATPVAAEGGRKAAAAKIGRSHRFWSNESKSSIFFLKVINRRYSIGENKLILPSEIDTCLTDRTTEWRAAAGLFLDRPQ
jgi:hypothetical protein